MSTPWHEVRVRGHYRIVALDDDGGPSARYAVMTCDGAWLRDGLLLPEAHAWLEHFAQRDARMAPPAPEPRDDIPAPPRRRTR